MNRCLPGHNATCEAAAQQQAYGGGMSGEDLIDARYQPRRHDHVCFAFANGQADVVMAGPADGDTAEVDPPARIAASRAATRQALGLTAVRVEVAG
jgi:hypothetical protein